MQAPAEATQEAEEEGLVLRRLVRDLQDENAWLKSQVSWGLVHAGNAYANFRGSETRESKPRIEPLDVAAEQSPHE